MKTITTVTLTLDASLNAWAGPQNPVLSGKDMSWFMDDPAWFLFQDTGIPECEEVPNFRFDGHDPHPVTKQMQERLSAAEYDAGKPDGVSGLQTEAQWKAFKQDYGLKEYQDFYALIPDSCFAHRDVEVCVGSPEADLITRFGKPVKVNTTMKQWRARNQFVPEGGLYICAEDGVVTSWQN